MRNGLENAIAILNVLNYIDLWMDEGILTFFEVSSYFLENLDKHVQFLQARIYTEIGIHLETERWKTLD